MLADTDPAFVAALFALMALGAVLPVPIDDREDHIVLAMVTPVVIGILGAPGILMIWAAVVAALPVIALRNLRGLDGRRWDGAAARRQLGWTATSALCVTTGAVVGVVVYQVVLGRSYPTPLTTVPEMLVAGIVIVAAWAATMATRILTIRVRRSLRDETLDPVGSVLLPYLLPALVGFPLVTACVALYEPEAPWRTMMVLWWALPAYAAMALDVHRRQIAQDLRREALANQRLAAIGEVSARIVHQSRHQVGLMGWSLHRLRPLVGRADPVDVQAAHEELDALTAAKDRLGQLLASEVLHETVTQRPEVVLADAGAAPHLPAVVVEVVDQLRAEAERAGVALHVDAPAGVDGPVAPRLRDVVFNLVDNAIDAARDEVRVVLWSEATGVVLDVGDDGPGIPGTDLGRVFEPFFTSKGDGTGMGLAIAEAVVGDLGGTLVHQRVDGWTHFVVRLPRSP